MGFFSKIKRLWSTSTVEETSTQTPLQPDESAKTDQTVSAAAQPTPADLSADTTARGAVPSSPVPTPAAAPDTAPMAPQAAPAPTSTIAPPDTAKTPAPPIAAGSDGTRPQWQTDLTLALRGAEPRLSIWLEHVLKGVEKADETLWERLRFFFAALDAPAGEAEKFISAFDRWLDNMEYEYVNDFRSELQYRLALALELEDEEDERSRLLLKLSEGLTKTKEQITKQIDGLLSTHSTIDEPFWDELEEILIMADVGFEPTMNLIKRLRERVRKSGSNNADQFKSLMREELEDIFKMPPRITAVNLPEVVLMVGVNGVGKTTTIAKLAYRAQMQGKKVLIAAGDTFRAAAIEQLQVWATRVGAGFYAKGPNSDPAAVAYEAVELAVKEGYDILFVDTAGRLQTKVDLMAELQKIRNVLGKKHLGAPHRTILTIDATTGQNAMSQTKIFNESCKLDEIILTKLDGTAKGGIVVAVAMEFGIPISYIGLGEKMEDLRPFNGTDFATALLGS